MIKFTSGKIVIVGSTLTKKLPRDLDVVHFISLPEFEETFGNFAEFLKEGKTGNWTKLRLGWSDLCIEQGRELERRINEGLRKHPIDYKIFPEGFNGDET
jgi:hypothetical protein